MQKKIKFDIPRDKENVKDFLRGSSAPAKRSVRGVYNNKIGKFTTKRILTQNTEVIRDEDIITFTSGQIFGEERYIDIYDKREKDYRQARLKDEEYKPGKDNYMKVFTAPFTIKCMSTEGQVYKISNHEFDALMKKDQRTLDLLRENYEEKKNQYTNKKQNMHVEMKFATNIAPPQDDEVDLDG